MAIKKAEVWKSAELAEKYLSEVRVAIPLSREQIDIMIKLIELSQKKIRSFLDLGCGNGILSAAILQKYPRAQGVLLDFSDHMIQSAKENLSIYVQNIDFVNFDYSDPYWIKKVLPKAPFDTVISGFSIHHQSNKRKREIYTEIYDLLKHGGLFLNIEHVSFKTKWLNKIFNEIFIDSLYKIHVHQGGKCTRAQLSKEYYKRPDKEANILVSVETQCQWLRKIGYQDVDCYFKIFELAIFGGRKPNGG
ncbi:MAG: methyltransferase domain-containing protein [Candidatus Omnitrophica bacterium]|nr:methyltransferase domain-containing protein [Candidatus Omnitrophota bacterium]